MKNSTKPKIKKMNRGKKSKGKKEHKIFYYTILSILLIMLLAGSAFGFNDYLTNSFLLTQQAKDNQASKEKTPEPTPPSPQPEQSNTKPPASSPAPVTNKATATFDCVAFNSTQRATLVQAADSLYAVYLSKKRDIYSPDSMYNNATEAQKLSILDGPYTEYLTKMDVNNSIYRQSISGVGQGCEKYYQQIPYGAK